MLPPNLIACAVASIKALKISTWDEAPRFACFVQILDGTTFSTLPSGTFTYAIASALISLADKATTGASPRAIVLVDVGGGMGGDDAGDLPLRGGPPRGGALLDP